ncbi:MAG TPA: hypothetical protein VMS55_15865 [Myxococcota bacterium]|nr:hypothetical protein [Myxococcota bacterium]
MEQEPKLRSIPPGGLGARSDAGSGARETGSRTPFALGVALAVALVLLVWSYFSLSSRIDALEGETQTLRQAISERDDVISAQRARLDQVHGRVQELLQLLEQPVPGTAPAAPPANPTTAEPPAEPPAEP